MLFTTINTPYDPINNIGTIRNEFDNVIDKSIYIDNDNIYKEMYNKFKQIFSSKEECYVNISTDRAISSATLSALNELYKYKNGKVYDSDLKIIYIDSVCDLNMNNYDETLNNYNYRLSVVSNLLTLSTDEDITRTYTKHMFPLKLEQFNFIGLNEVSPYEENILLKGNSDYYDMKRLNKNIENILNKIVNKIGDSPTAVIFDMSVFDINIAPCTIRENKTNVGLNLDQLNLILKHLSEMNNKNKNIKMIDITGHYLSIEDTSPAFRVTIETITKIYSKILNLKEYSINIFNEHTRFLIYKPVDELCEEKEDMYGDNYGWYILRNVPIDYKNDMLKEIDNDSITIIDIPLNNEDEDVDEEDAEIKEIQVMISSTTILEQNDKCYYTSTSYKDCTLYPDEKMAMAFELIN
jgi:arginase family enzyme